MLLLLPPVPLRLAVTLVFGMQAVFAAPPPVVPARPSPALACLILPEKVADVGSQVVGIVEHMEVDRGDTVRKGQVVARLRADVERASTTVARSRAESEGDLRGALAARGLAQLKLDRAITLEKQSFVSRQAVEQAKSEFDVADERAALAREQLATSSREVSVSQAQVAQRVLRSPIDGVVIERYISAGERVEDKPMLKIADISTLRVEVVAPTSLFGSLQQGQALSVQPDLPGSAAHIARIVQIDRVLDPASNTFRVRLSLPNDDGSLPAGLRCRIDLGARPAEPRVAPAAVLLPTAVSTAMPSSTPGPRSAAPGLRVSPELGTPNAQLPAAALSNGARR